jgi:hypothetical protein
MASRSRVGVRNTSSLSQVRAVEVKSRATEQVELPEQVVSIADNKVVIGDEQDVEVFNEPSANEFKNIWFISNKPLSKNIKENLSYDGIQSHDVQLFTNRTTDDLLNMHGVQHIWTDISNKHALKWVACNIMNKGSYKIVLVISAIGCQKLGKWITDLRDTDQIDIEIKLKDLKKLKSLTVSGLLENLSVHTHIHPPPTLFDTLTKNGSVIKKKA